MTFKYRGTMITDGNRTLPIKEALDGVNRLISGEFNLKAFTVTSISVDDDDTTEFEFTSPSRVCVEDYPFLVEVK